MRYFETASLNIRHSYSIGSRDTDFLYLSFIDAEGYVIITGQRKQTEPLDREVATLPTVTIESGGDLARVPVIRSRSPTPEVDPRRRRFARDRQVALPPGGQPS